MICKQCGKFFLAKDITEKFCSIECFTRAQLERLKYCNNMKFIIYHNGTEVKTIPVYVDKGGVIN